MLDEEYIAWGLLVMVACALSLMGEGVFTFTIPESWIYGVLGTVILGALGWFGRWLRPRLAAILDGAWRIRQAERAVDASSPGLWLAPSIKVCPPDDYARQLAKSIPVIVVANLKGGVGKTTAVANLAAHYDCKKNRRVLAIDFDFQGSLSANILSREERDNSFQLQIDGNPSKAAQLVDGRTGAWVRNVSVGIEGTRRGRCIPSYYTLSSMENRVMVEWLIAKRREDIRYSLARALLDLDVQSAFDLVLIDAPPRLTTASVQAFCASNQVLVPTILDGLSVEATGGFLSQLATNQPIWPNLHLLGVFANMTKNLTADRDGVLIDGRLQDHEAEQLRTLQDVVPEALEEAKPPLRAPAGSSSVLPTECFIPEKTELGRVAGERIAYRMEGGSVATQELSRAFDRLGDEIDRRL